MLYKDYTFLLLFLPDMILQAMHAIRLLRKAEYVGMGVLV